MDKGRKADFMLIWTKDAYQNGFKCPACGALLYDMAGNHPTGNLLFESTVPGLSIPANCTCGQCGAHVAVAQPNTGGFAPGMGGRYPGSVPREKVQVIMYGVGVSTNEACIWMTEREEEFSRIVKEAKIKAVYTDPAGRFQAFLFLHPKQRDKAYGVLRRHFKTAFLIVNPVIADISQ